MYVFHNPLKVNVSEDITWDYAQKEIAAAKGFNTGSGTLSKGPYFKGWNELILALQMSMFSLCLSLSAYYILVYLTVLDDSHSLW